MILQASFSLSLPRDLPGLVRQLLVAHAADDDLVLVLCVFERERVMSKEISRQTNSNTMMASKTKKKNYLTRNW